MPVGFDAEFVLTETKYVVVVLSACAAVKEVRHVPFGGIVVVSSADVVIVTLSIPPLAYDSDSWILRMSICALVAPPVWSPAASVATVTPGALHCGGAGFGEVTVTVTF